MKRTAILTAVVLLGSAFVVASPASAEDVEECQEQQIPERSGVVQACAYDSTEGNQEQACKESGTGTYEGRTGAEAHKGGDAPSFDAEAAGEETCRHGWLGFSQEERVFADVDFCLQEEGWRCQAGGGVEAQWTQSLVEATGYANSAEGLVGFGAQYGTDHAGCEAGAYVFSFGTPSVIPTYEDKFVDCPADGPPASPNPGWGQVTPDVPDMLEEQLPE